MPGILLQPHPSADEVPCGIATTITYNYAGNRCEVNINTSTQYSYCGKTSHLLDEREFLEFRYEDKGYHHEVIKSCFVCVKRNHMYLGASSLTSPLLNPKS